MKSNVFGPVPSRRLGFSLGIDVVPFKTCTLDCIYCQLGRTTVKTNQRKDFFSVKEILDEIKRNINSQKRIDYITFSGSGEPTLNSRIGQMIEEIKKITSLPVAVLTNGTLLYLPEVQEELKKADLVIPSLDAADEDTFTRVNRPHPSLKIHEVISGMAEFSRNFKGKIWLEVMLVKGINDSPWHLQKLTEVIRKIKVEKIQLNTPVRPPAEDFVFPLDEEDLRKICSFFGKNCEVIAKIQRKKQKAFQQNIEIMIHNMVKRRPVTIEDIAISLGIHRNEVIKYIESLIERRLVSFRIYEGKRYYYSLT